MNERTAAVANLPESELLDRALSKGEELDKLIREASQIWWSAAMHAARRVQLFRLPPGEGNLLEACWPESCDRNLAGACFRSGTFAKLQLNP